MGGRKHVYWDWVNLIKNEPLPSTVKLVAYALATSADFDTGRNAHPGVALLMKHTGLKSDKTVRDALEELRDADLIERVKKGSNAGRRGLADEYNLLLPDDDRQAGSVEPMFDLSATLVHDPPSVDVERQGGRGTRIPQPFIVTDDMVAWARERCPHVDGKAETERFENYWLAKAGRDAAKLDWAATWRNWMLNAAERIPARGSASGSGAASRPAVGGWVSQQIAAPGSVTYPDEDYRSGF